MKPSQPRRTPMLDCTGRLCNLGVSIALEEEGTLLARGGHSTVNCRLSEAPKSRAYHGGTKGSNPACSSGESRAKLTSHHRALAIFAGDRGFESISLQQGVSSEPCGCRGAPPIYRFPPEAAVPGRAG